MGGRKGTKDPVRPPHVASLPSGLGCAGDVLVVSETRVVGNRQRVSWLSPSRPPSVRKALQTAAARATCNTRSNTSARRPSRLSDMRLALVGARQRWKQGVLAESALVGASQRWPALLQVLLQLSLASHENAPDGRNTVRDSPAGLRQHSAAPPHVLGITWRVRPVRCMPWLGRL